MGKEKETVLVTGGAGFIGSNICDRLLEDGYKVIALDNLSTGRKENINHLAFEEDFKFIESDLRNSNEIKEIIQNYKPGSIIHTAAQMNVRHSVEDPKYDAEVNILGLVNLLEACKESNVKKIVFSSTGGAIYGDNVSIPTSEDEEKDPCSPYGISKLASEKYLKFYESLYGIRAVSLRYSNVYGPRQNPKGEAGVVAIFMNKLLNPDKEEQPIINGPGEQTRDYVFVEDVVNANLLALRKNISGEYNVSTGKEISVNELFRELISLTNSKKEEKHGPAMEGEQERSCLSYEKFKEATSWEPKYDLTEGLEKTLDWYKNNY